MTWLVAYFIVAAMCAPAFASVDRRLHKRREQKPDRRACFAFALWGALVWPLAVPVVAWLALYMAETDSVGKGVGGHIE